MMQRTANENAACLRRICKRSDQPCLLVFYNMLFNSIFRNANGALLLCITNTLTMDVVCCISWELKFSFQRGMALERLKMALERVSCHKNFTAVTQCCHVCKSQTTSGPTLEVFFEIEVSFLMFYSIAIYLRAWLHKPGWCQLAGILARLLNAIKINFAITWQPGLGPLSRKTR